MSFLLRLIDKFKRIVSSNQLPTAEEYQTKKNHTAGEDLENKYPKIKIDVSYSDSEKLPRSKPKIPEYSKYTRARKLAKDYVVLDFETTGLSQFDSKIIQIGAVRYHNHEVVDQYTTYVNPLTEISQRITRINGITNEHVKNAPLIHEVLPELIEFIGDHDIVAHNASFDLKFLLYNMNDNDIPYKRFRVLDTLSLARKHINTKNHKLVTLKDHFKLHHYKSHSALDDCYVTGEVYKYCYEMEVNPPKLTFENPDYYNDYFVLYTIGEELYKNKQIDEAEEYLLASISKGNNAPAVFERLAIIYRRQKRYQDEIEICKQGKFEVAKTQGNYRNEMFDQRINRAQEWLEKEKVLKG